MYAVSLFDRIMHLIVTAHSTLDSNTATAIEFKNAVVVDISEQPEKVLRNLEVQLNYNNSVVFKKTEFSNRWVAQSEARALELGTLHNSVIVVHTVYSACIYISVNHEKIFKDSFAYFINKKFENWENLGLIVIFRGRNGDKFRAWFSLLSKEMFYPHYALFKSTKSNQTVFYPNDQSFVNPDHVEMFEFIGMFIAKALTQGIILNFHLARFFYKHILRIKPDLVDLKEVDNDLYNSLVWILENKVDGDKKTFTVEIEEFGDRKIIELKEHGYNILLTEENKKQYVDSIVDYKLMFQIEKQLEAFLRGFYTIIPYESIMKFEVFELDMLLAGAAEIDVDDWERNTEYTGYNIYDQQIIWFWKVVREFDQPRLRELLQLATGSSGVPMEGFSGLRSPGGIEIKKFEMHRNYSLCAADTLSISHYRDNTIDLPRYGSEAKLREKLILAIEEGANSFGFN